MVWTCARGKTMGIYWETDAEDGTVMKEETG